MKVSFLFVATAIQVMFCGTLCFGQNPKKSITYVDSESVKAYHRVVNKFNMEQEQKSQNYIDRLYDHSTQCYQETNCGPGYDYCDNASCLAIIDSCHFIPDSIIGKVLISEVDSSKPFTAWQINRILEFANCANKKVEFFSDGNVPEIFTIKNVDTGYYDTVSPYKAYYSVPLLTELMNNGMRSMVLYTGAQTSSGKNVVIFAAIFSNAIRYYDVTDTQP